MDPFFRLNVKKEVEGMLSKAGPGARYEFEKIIPNLENFIQRNSALIEDLASAGLSELEVEPGVESTHLWKRDPKKVTRVALAIITFGLNDGKGELQVKAHIVPKFLK